VNQPSERALTRRACRAAPSGTRWCKECAAYLDEALFGTYTPALCKEHWLIFNREKGARFRGNNPGYDAQRHREYARHNPEKMRAHRKKQADRQKALGYPSAKKWASENPEKIRKHWRDKDRRWRAENPDKQAAAAHRRRARRRRAPGHHTWRDLQEIREGFWSRCIYCSSLAETWDHIIPVAEGGTNFRWNMAPACKSCNSRKQAQDPLLFVDLCPTESAKWYIFDALHEHSKVCDPPRYKRSRHEKVPGECLWDEARRVYLRDGRVSAAGLRGTRYSVSTYIRRLGGVRAINHILDKKEEAT